MSKSLLTLLVVAGLASASAAACNPKNDPGCNNHTSQPSPAATTTDPAADTDDCYCDPKQDPSCGN